jgi:hypothetical protein
MVQHFIDNTYPGGEQHKYVGNDTLILIDITQNNDARPMCGIDGSLRDMVLRLDVNRVDLRHSSRCCERGNTLRI